MKTAFLTLLALSISQYSFAEGSFDEMIDSTGSARTAYQEYAKENPIDSILPSLKAAKEYMKNPLQDKIKILPVPLILEASEVLKIKAQTRVRFEALFSFFEDVILDEKKALGKNGILSETLLNQIILESGYKDLQSLRKLWAGKNSKYIHFFYGPDLIRNPQGDWVVMEDNVGLVGGLVDVISIHSFFEEIYNISPSYKLGFKLKTQFLKFIEKFLQTHTGETVNSMNWDKYAVGFSEYAGFSRFELYNLDVSKKFKDRDLEDFRKYEFIQKIFGELVPFLHSIFIAKDKSIKTDEANPNWIVDHNRSRMESLKFFKKNLRAVLNIDVYDFIDQKVLEKMFQKQGVAMLHPPGVEILGHKALLPLMEKMISFYHVSTPEGYATSPKTILFSEYKQFSELRKIILSDQSVVVKKASECQGRGVYLLPKMNLQEKEEAARKIRDSYINAAVKNKPAPLYIVQDYVEASTLLGHYIDIRPLYMSGGSGNFMDQHIFWGRAARKNKDFGKTNVSISGKELIVLTNQKKYAELLAERCQKNLVKTETK